MLEELDPSAEIEETDFVGSAVVGEPITTSIPLEEAWTGIIEGLEVSAVFNPVETAFIGTVANVSGVTKENVQIQVHLMNDLHKAMELPTYDIGKLANATSVDFELEIPDEVFDIGIPFNGWDIKANAGDAKEINTKTTEIVDTKTPVADSVTNDEVSNVDIPLDGALDLPLLKNSLNPLLED